MTTIITLFRVTQGNQNVLLAKFPYDKRIYSTILNSRLGYWNKFHRGMILKNDPIIIAEFKKLMKGIAVINEAKLYSTTEFKERLRAPTLENLNENLKTKVNHFRSYLEQQRYSENTVKSYTDCLGSFFRYFNNKDKKNYF